jgi:hypothetical protein
MKPWYKQEGVSFEAHSDGCASFISGLVEQEWMLKAGGGSLGAVEKKHRGLCGCKESHLVSLQAKRKDGFEEFIARLMQDHGSQSCESSDII